MDKKTSSLYDFYFSNSSLDNDLIEKIKTKFEVDYLAKCYKMRDFKPENISKIISAIDNSAVFLVFITKNYAKENNCINELYYAINHLDSENKFKILPIVLDSTYFDKNNNLYKNIRFYIDRFHHIYYQTDADLNNLAYEIFNFIKIKNQNFNFDMIRLKLQNKIIVDNTNYIFSPLVNPNSVILDIGCGLGINIMMRLENLNYKSLLGVDKDETVIKKANSLYKNDKNTFLNCDITSDIFVEEIHNYLEKINQPGFDLINISQVFLYLVEPIKLLKKLRGFLKSDGKLFIQEIDDAVNITYPYNPFFSNANSIWLDCDNSDRNCARKMPYYLTEAGFKNIDLAKCGISNLNLNQEELMAFWDLYYNYKLWDFDKINSYGYNSTKALLDEYCQDYDNIYHDYLDNKIFVQLGLFYYVCKK